MTGSGFSRHRQCLHQQCPDKWQGAKERMINRGHGGLPVKADIPGRRDQRPAKNISATHRENEPGTRRGTAVPPWTAGRAKAGSVAYRAEGSHADSIAEPPAEALIDKPDEAHQDDRYEDPVGKTAVTAVNFVKTGSISRMGVAMDLAAGWN
jgi:hypothetical protein